MLVWQSTPGWKQYSKQGTNMIKNEEGHRGERWTNLSEKIGRLISQFLETIDSPP